jgi:hypothetical protein
MSTGHSIEKRGIELLKQHLKAQGRSVVDSDNKTFDLIVDGRYAEVKCKGKPYEQLDFIGFTKKQFRELEEGPEFQLFIVCNVDNPSEVQVREIPARELLRSPPEVDPTYYWYKRQLDGLFDEGGGS